MKSIEQIKYKGIQFAAAYCERCKSKMWPADMLAAHKGRHHDKDDLFDAIIIPLRSTFTKMKKR